MRCIIVLILATTISGCINSQEKTQEVSSESILSEDFSSFYLKFYSDTSFQKDRIIKPLKGTIKSWSDDVVTEESWYNKKITITPKEKFTDFYKNLETDLIIKNNEVIEKYWIEQSGFIIERKFILIDREWYLDCYNITNL